MQVLLATLFDQVQRLSKHGSWRLGRTGSFVVGIVAFGMRVNVQKSRSLLPEASRHHAARSRWVVQGGCGGSGRDRPRAAQGRLGQGSKDTGASLLAIARAWRNRPPWRQCDNRWLAIEDNRHHSGRVFGSL